MKYPINIWSIMLLFCVTELWSRTSGFAETPLGFGDAYVAEFRSGKLPLVATVEVEGQKLDLVVDLGINGTVLRPGSIDAPSKGKVTGTSSGRSVVAERLGELEFSLAGSDVRFHSRTAAVEFSLTNRKIPGLLGTDFLKNNMLYVSNSEQFFAIIPTTRGFSPLKNLVGCRFTKSGLIEIPLVVDDAKLYFEVDTGFSEGLGVPEKLFQKLATSTEAVVGMPVLLSTPTGNQEFDSIVVDNLVILGTTFKEFRVCKTQHFVVGTGLLDRFDYLINLHEGEFRYQLKIEKPNGSALNAGSLSGVDQPRELSEQQGATGRASK